MYSNCRELSLHRFNEISVTGDLSYLLENKKEKASPEQLEHTYESILEEYEVLMDDKSFSKRRKLAAEISYCINKINCLEAMLMILPYKISMSIDDLEINQKTCTSFNTNFDQESLSKSLSGITNRYNIKLKVFEEMNKEITSTFEDSLIMVQKIYGQKINRKDTMVSEWCAIIKSINKSKV